MNALIKLHNASFARLEALSGTLLPLLARFAFGAVLLVYFLKSAGTKIGDGFLGLFQPAPGAYFQIFPRAIEAAGYSPDALSLWHYLVVLAGTWAEILLPVFIIAGLFTRLSAIGMIGFIIVQSLTDLYGHRLIDEPASVGAWFDAAPGSLLMDQRLLWIMLLLILVFKGAGPLSLDWLLSRARRSKARSNPQHLTSSP